jgi:multimeric flavodoxin WrbA
MPMKIAIANGNPDAGNTTFESYLDKLCDLLRSSAHEIQVLRLRDLDIRYCIGCFGCWLKSPGRCVQHDEMEQVIRAYVRSRLFIMASPVTMGFTSSLLKKAHDRILPVLMPYIVFTKGEMHHRKRYRRHPDVGVLVQESADTDAEDMEIMRHVYERDMLNIYGRLRFFHPISTPLEEVADEIDHL